LTTLVGVRIHPPLLRQNRFEPLLGHLHRRPAREAPDDHERSTTHGTRVRGQRVGGPEIAKVGHAKVARHHPDDVMRDAVEAEQHGQHVAAASESALPEIVGHDDRRRWRVHIRAGERPAHDWARADDLEDLRRDAKGVDALGRAVRREGRLPELDRCESIEHVGRLFAPVQQIARGDRGAIEESLVIVRRDDHSTIDAWIAKWPEHDRVGHRHRRRIRAECHGEHQDDGRGESRLVRDDAPGRANVLPENATQSCPGLVGVDRESTWKPSITSSRDHAAHGDADGMLPIAASRDRGAVPFGGLHELLRQISQNALAPLRVAHGDGEQSFGKSRRSSHDRSRMASSPDARLLSATCVALSASRPRGVSEK
jgi:hypothetical protein